MEPATIKSRARMADTATLRSTIMASAGGDAAMSRLPALMADPAMVLRGATDTRSLVVALNAQDRNGDPVIAAVRLAHNEGRVNWLPSIQGRNQPNWLAKQIDAGRLLYSDEGKLPEVRSHLGLQSPPGPANLPTRPRGAIDDNVTKSALVKRALDDPSLFSTRADRLTDPEGRAIEAGAVAGVRRPGGGDTPLSRDELIRAIEGATRKRACAMEARP